MSLLESLNDSVLCPRTFISGMFYPFLKRDIEGTEQQKGNQGSEILVHIRPHQSVEEHTNKKSRKLHQKLPEK